MNIVYEAVCANPLRLFLSLPTFNKIKRIIYSGDHKQLPPCIKSDEDKEALDEDEEEPMSGTWPTACFDVQCPTHSDAEEV